MKIIQNKRFIALLMVAMLILSLAACGRRKQDDTTSSVITPPSPVETAPPVTESVETDPPETEPVETEPPVTETAEPETTETEPVETEPVETEPLCEHKFYPNAKTVIPTCKEEGYTEYTCKLCGEKVKDNFKPIVAHLYVNQVISYASCTTDGLEAMVCTYCGEKKPSEQTDGHLFEVLKVVDDSYIYGKCTDCETEELIFDEYWLKPDIMSYFKVNGDYRYNFDNEFTSSNRSNPYQLEFTVTLDTITDIALANNKNLMRYNNYANSIFVQSTVADENGNIRADMVEIRGNDDENTHFIYLKQGESVTFRLWVRPESDSVDIYVNDGYVMTLDDKEFQFEKEPGLRWGHKSMGTEYTFSNISIIRPLVERKPEEGFVPAYGHNVVTTIVDTHTFTHHKVAVSECERCGDLFEAKGVKGEEHRFNLIERVPDSQTAAGFTVYGFEIFECGDCGYVLKVSSNHKGGHFYEVDRYTGKFVCRCGSIYLGDEYADHNGNADAGVIVGREEDVNE